MKPSEEGVGLVYVTNLEAYPEVCGIWVGTKVPQTTTVYVLIDQCLQDISHSTLRPTEQCLITIPAMMRTKAIAK